ncbi:hypothetical protein [Pedobacter gandavensis]|nr:hypothetical protein [Pedobacter gandavensis]
MSTTKKQKEGGVVLKSVQVLDRKEKAAPGHPGRCTAAAFH